MLKFMRHQQKLTPERIQKQKELYAFTKGCYHGFPSKASAISWDPELRLLALATKNGDIRVYGAEGVEFYGEHGDNDATVVQIVILPGRGHIVSLCEDNSLHLWQLQQDQKLTGLHKINSTSLDGKLKKISVIKADNACENLLIGTEGGNIYLLNLATFVMSDNIIYQDVVMQNVPEDYKVNPGPVECIAQHPTEQDKILIGYQRGLIVLWDKKNLTADQTYISSQQLECVCWHSDTTKFISSHNDGSYVIWSANSSEKPEDGPNTVYGPFPCKPITKIMWPKAKDGDFIIFSGGMPRASYGERTTVSVILGEEQVAYNLTSRVIDFLVIDDKDTGAAECLVILAEEEIIFQDLSKVDWPSHHNPYLSSLHSSAITCSCHVSNVTSEVFDKIKEAGNEQHKSMSDQNWPVNGGEHPVSDSKTCEILLTGHEDGTVRFWNASSVDLSLLYTLKTSHIFVSDDPFADEALAEDDDWPPFKKIGIFDPYSDDPRYAIKKMEMCPYSGALVIAGTAGQVIVLQLAKDLEKIELHCVEVNLVAENDNFVWKSHSKFDINKKDLIQFYSSGLQPTAVMQFCPPASCTSLNLHSEWGLVACGTAHGFALLDFIQKKCILAKSTLSPSDLINAADEGPMSRRKSLKKSLRESFRRLRRGRSQRKSGRNKPKGLVNPTSPVPVKTSAVSEEENIRPVERAIEARTHSADYVGSMVRCLHLTKCFISTNQVMTATLWAGTNSGTIFVYTIAIPPSDKRSSTTLTVQLGKEINLKHGAPVISIMILDAANRPFPDPLAVKKEVSPPPDTSGSHKVLICSEEQFKVFSLPQLKHFCKYKLTAHDGSRVRKISGCDFVSSVDSAYKESSFFVATNQGDISVFSLPDCRRQVQAQCLKKEDISGINSIVFTKKGEAIYQVSSSELARVSLSARYITKPNGKVNITSSLQKTEKLVEKKCAPVATIPEENNTEENNEDIKVANKETIVEAANATTEDSKNGKATSTEVAKKTEEVNGDQSMLSGDITIDSIKDHMDESKLQPDKCNEIVIATSNAEASAITTVISGPTKTKQESTTNVSVIKSTTVTSITSQETSSVQVVETTTSSELNHNAVNGSENKKRRAPLAKTESFFVKNPKEA